MPASTTNFVPLNIALLTVSDTRSLETDSSGDFLENSLLAAGHNLIERKLLPDEIELMIDTVSNWISNSDIDVVISTGGTGFTDRDSTPEALIPLFEKQIDGFGELFRQLSYREIGTSTVQSRCFAGLANRTLVFALPGSTGACRTGWNGILIEQLDSRHKPCNFVTHTRARDRASQRGASQ